MIFKFRIVLDINDEDVFRDVEIKEDASFEDLHNSIVQACDLDGQQMASFYVSNDAWEQKDEITLFDMSDTMEESEEKKVMSEWAVHEMVNEKEHKLLYIYDFFNMWTFFVELIDITEVEPSVDYPRMVASVGLMPEDVPEKKFTTEKAEKELDEFDEFNSDTFDQAGYDEFNEDWN